MSGQKMLHILQVEDSLEGILSGVSYAYKSRYGHADTRIRVIQENETLELFSEYYRIPTDPEAAGRVYHAILEKIGADALTCVEHTAVSDDPDRAQIIYRFLILGFANGARALDYVSDDCVVKLHDIDRRVGREAYHWQEFLRFRVHHLQELQGEAVPSAGLQVTGGQDTELLTAVIKPHCRILPYVMPHYADRFAGASFLIYDESHDIAGLHGAGRPWVLVSGFAVRYPQAETLLRDSDGEEEQMQELWRIFFRATDIPERANRGLQRNLLPLWMRRNMTEFQEREEP